MLFVSVLYGSSSAVGLPLGTVSPPPESSPGTSEFWLTWTSSKGSSGSAHGNTTNQSKATVTAASSVEPTSFPASPNGSLRQIHPYIVSLPAPAAGPPTWPARGPAGRG